MTVIPTARLNLREALIEDAGFILTLLNDSAFIQFIGDRGVRCRSDARHYIRAKMIAGYAQNGFGMYVVQRIADSALIGICGLVKRAELDDVDIGFALLPEFCGHGYALEAAQAVLLHASQDLNIKRVAAITTCENVASIRLLEKLGFQATGKLEKPDNEASVEVFLRCES